MSRSKKGRRLRLAGVAVVISLAVFLLGTIPALAQSDASTKQLNEAQATIADQEQIIQELRENYFKSVGELNVEIQILRSRITEQENLIQQYEAAGAVPLDQQKQVIALKQELAQKSAMVDKLFADVNKLSAQVALLEAQNGELEAMVAQYQAGVEGVDVVALQSQISKQKKKITEQEGLISELINDYFSTTKTMGARIDELELQNAKLSTQASKDSDTIMKYAKLEGNLKKQIDDLKCENTELKGLRDRQQKTIDTLQLQAKDQSKQLKLQSDLSECTNQLHEAKYSVAELSVKNTQLQLDNSQLSRQVEECKPLADKNKELEASNAQLSQSSDTLKWLVGILVVGGFFLAGGGL